MLSSFRLSFILAITLLPLFIPVNKILQSDLELLPEFDDPLPPDFKECTTGVASGSVTPDGRPLLWKNRDIGDYRQEYHYVDDGRIPFIGLTYGREDDRGVRYYAGLNAAGFAIENSDAHNMFSHGPHNDGETMMEALATCRTVDDFEALLDTADRHDEQGRYGYNYGVIDAFDGAAMFEAAQFSYTRYDAVDAEDGFEIRSNYSYIGTDDHAGWFRHNRAYELWKAAADDNRLTARFIYGDVVRDLCSEGIDPYPLPFDGYCEYNRQDYPYGFVPIGDAICRSSTRSVMVAQGVRDGERPDDAVLWAMLGSPLTGVATPLWVRAGSVPPEYNSWELICERVDELSDLVYYRVRFGGGYRSGVDTWRLVRPDGKGVWDYTLPLEDWVFDKTERFIRSPRFNYDRLESFQNTLASQVYDSLNAFEPDLFAVTDLIEPVWENGIIRLAWEPFEFDRGGDLLRTRNYDVYRCPEPFRDGNSGELIATVELTEFSDEDPLFGGGYYLIRPNLNN